MQSTEYSAAQVLAAVGGPAAVAPVSLEWALARVLAQLGTAPTSATHSGLLSQIATVYNRPGYSPLSRPEPIVAGIVEALGGNPQLCYTLEAGMQEWARVAGAYQGFVFADHPIHYYRFDEAAGDFRDLIGSADATVHANVGRQVPGLVAGGDTAASFPGTAGASVAAPIGTAPSGQAARSIECWLSSEAAAGQYGLWGYGNQVGSEAFNCRRVNEGNGGLYLYAWSNDLFFDFSATTPDVADGEPHHLVVTYDGNLEAGMIIDGVEYLQDFFGVLDTGDTAFRMGDTIVTETWAGVLDEFAVYDYRLPTAQAQRHYAAGRM